MTVPCRIQLSRRKGWRLAEATANPLGAVNVARPSRWGNPFGVAHARRAASPVSGWVMTSRLGVSGPIHWGRNGRRLALADAVEAFRLHCGPMGAHEVDPADLAPLRGRDLACWCPLDQPCHADVLLELANGDEAA